MGFRKTAVAAGMLLAFHAALAAEPAKMRSPRGQLVYEIVTKWAPHVQETYGVRPSAWARDMAGTFSGADMASLAAAAQATDFEAMNMSLLATAPSQLETNLVLSSNPSPASLGDADNDLVYVPVTPCRIIDTRVAGGAIAANSSRDFDITSVGDFAFQGGASGDCGIGAAGSFAAAVINFTVVSPQAAGYITAFPAFTSRPLASTVNYTAGDIRANLAVVKLDQGSSPDELSVYTFAQTHVVADVTGYLINPAATNLNCTSTSVTSFSLPASSVNFYNNPTCPAGYTATTPYCWTAAAGVYSQGSGYNANGPGNATFCSWQNTTANSQTVFGGNVCCRVPGR